MSPAPRAPSVARCRHVDTSAAYSRAPRDGGHSGFTPRPAWRYCNTCDAFIPTKETGN